MEIERDYDDPTTKIIPLVGTTVTDAVYDHDDNGYPFVRIIFDTGQVLTVKEAGQCGYISVRLT